MARMIVPTVLALLIGGSAWALGPNGEYVGRFNYSCPQLIKMYEKSGVQKDGSGVTFNRSFSVIIGWMAGYMSRVNTIRQGKADFYGNMADEATWIAKWCEANQKSDLMDAMEALTKERTTTPSKPKPAKAVRKKPVAPEAPGRRVN
jgi:hypothetical protein